MRKEPTGIIPPLTTPFTAEGDVYEKGLRELVEFQIRNGSHGLFICGTYGSGPIMTVAERKSVHEIVIDQARGRVAVIAHVGSASTAQSIELGRHAAAAGADCIGAIPPYYHHHDEHAVLEHFKRLVEAVDVPVFIYNNPKTSGFTLTPAFLERLADAGVAGIKDSSFSFIDFSHFVLAMEDRPHFRLLVGSEALALPCWMIGAVGAVCGLANVFPELTVALWETFLKKDYEAAAELQLRVNRGRQILHIPSSTNAACYYVLHVRGVDAGYPKAPILPVEKGKGERMVAAFRAMGLLEPARGFRKTA